MATSSHQIWFWAKPCSGWLRSPVSLAHQSSQRARRRWRSSRSASWPVLASVAKQVTRCQSRSAGRQDRSAALMTARTSPAWAAALPRGCGSASQGCLRTPETDGPTWPDVHQRRQPDAIGLRQGRPSTGRSSRRWSGPGSRRRDPRPPTTWSSPCPARREVTRAPGCRVTDSYITRLGGRWPTARTGPVPRRRRRRSRRPGAWPPRPGRPCCAPSSTCGRATAARSRPGPGHEASLT
jgi:hypothetical protein